MERYKQIEFEKYQPLFEAFKAGTNQKVMKLLGSLLNKRIGAKLDADIPTGYQNSLGKFRSFLAFLPDERELRINFLLKNSDYIYSVDIFKRDAVDPSETIVFDEETNIVQIINTITDLVQGTLEESDEKKEDEKVLSLYEARRKSKSGDIVKQWIISPGYKEEREQLIQKEKFSNLYKMFLQSDDIDFEGVKVPSTTTFMKFVKEYLKDMGMTNPHVRATYKKKQASSETFMILPEQKPEVKKFQEPFRVASDWHDAFEDMEDDFYLLMSDREVPNYGQIVYGNGGTGKSFFYSQQMNKYNIHMERGAPNVARLVKILYDHRDKDAIWFDDADTIITNKNSANILKSALDGGLQDKYGYRLVYLPKATGELKEIEPDHYDEEGNLTNAFRFNSNIIVVTNIKEGIKDQALRTRCYTNPIFMTKEDIVDKIKETCDPSIYGVSKQQVDEVAKVLTELVETGQFNIKNEDLSYRFFNMGLQYIKHFPTRWAGKVMRKLKIGIRVKI